MIKNRKPLDVQKLFDELIRVHMELASFYRSESIKRGLRAKKLRNEAFANQS